MKMMAWYESANTEARHVVNLKIRKWFAKASTLNKKDMVCYLYNHCSYTSSHESKFRL
jgi:hypothetical protein